MATEKKNTTKKTSTKGSPASASETPAVSARTVKKVQKRVKKLSVGVNIALVAVLLVALAAGAGTAYLMTRNDTFTLDTNASLLFTDGDTVDKSALTCQITAISFGKDIADTLTVVTTLPETDSDTLHLTEGVYYTTYTVKTPLGRTIKRIQTITVLPANDVEAGGESLG